MREARIERIELYGRENDQGKVTYNDNILSAVIVWPIFFRFFFPEVAPEVGGLDYGSH